MDELKNKIREVTARMLEIDSDELGDDDLFEDHDMDSLIAMQLTAILENEYDLTIPNSVIQEMTSVTRTAEIVTELLEK